ncbi:hypothetical protein Tco_1391388 [Tanacetum coccineum]
MEIDPEDAEVTLIDETQGRNDDNLMFDTSVSDEHEVKVEKVVSTAEVTTDSATTTTVDELTLARTLIEIKSSKNPKDKGKDKAETDYELAQRLQQEEQESLSIKEKSKLFKELFEKRRKFFVAKRAEEKRNKPPTKAQQRKLFDKEMKKVNTFVDFRTELVEGTKKLEHTKKVEDETAQESSSKRVGDELEQEKTKKQKINDNQEEAEMRKLIENCSINRTDGSSRRYSSMIQMLRNFDREDLETLWKLVKAKHGNTRPEEEYERVLWLRLLRESTTLIQVNFAGYKVTTAERYKRASARVMRRTAVKDKIDVGKLVVEEKEIGSCGGVLN